MIFELGPYTHSPERHVALRLMKEASGNVILVATTVSGGDYMCDHATLFRFETDGKIYKVHSGWSIKEKGFEMEEGGEMIKVRG